MLVVTLASSPAESAVISISFPLSTITILSLSFSKTNNNSKRPSLSSDKYSFVSASSSFTEFSILYAINPVVLNAFLRTSRIEKDFSKSIVSLDNPASSLV